jgi:hypothetical protein
MKSELSEHNISLMHYKITRWPSFSLHLSHIHTSTFPHRHWRPLISRTIKSEMSEHNISLMHYEITWWPSFSLHLSHIHTSTFHTDTHHARASWQSNRSCRSTISRWCITKQRGDPHSLFICLIYTRPLFTQTLTTLELPDNRIGGKGAQHLADALRNNAVTLILSSSISYTHVHFSHRHWRPLTSSTIKSETKEHNI